MSLSARLPADYSQNMALMTADQREAIQEDKQRWYKAHRMIRDVEPLNIRSWLSGLFDLEYRRDMARRLNTIKDKSKSRKGENDGKD